jgi:hypothetical protein
MRRLFLISIILLGALTACGGDDQTPPPASRTPIPPSATPRPTSTPVVIPQTETEPGKQAQLRVVHASPDLEAVDLYLDGANIGTRFTVGLFHNRPLAFNAGDYTLNVFPAGTDPTAGTPLIEYPVTLPEDESTIIMLLGSAADLQVQTYQEDLGALPENTARLSLINAVPDSPPITFQEVNRVLARDVNFGGRGGPVKIDAGNHSFDFISGATILTSLELPITEKSAYTVVLLGEPGGMNARAVAFQTRANSETQVRVVHASPDAGEVDVFLDDHQLAAGLPYREWTDWLNLRSVAYDLKIVPAGNPEAEPLYRAKIALNPDKVVDLILVDEVQRLRIVQIEEDTSVTPGDQARLMFVNAAYGFNELRVSTPGGPVASLRDIGFGTASPPTLLSATRESFIFETTDKEPSEIDSLPATEWLAGYTHTIVVTGYPNSDPLVLSTEVGTETETGTGTPSPSEYQLRVIHALFDVGPLTIEMNGNPIVTNLTPGTSTDYITLPIDSVELTVSEVGVGEPLLTESFVPEGLIRATLFIYGSRTDAYTQVARDLMFEIPINASRLRLFHGAPLQPALVALYTQPPAPDDEDSATPVPQPISESISFGLASEEKDLPAGTYDLQIVDHDTRSAVVTLPGITLEKGTFYDLLVLPNADGQGARALLVPHYD